MVKPLNFFYKTGSPMILKLGTQHKGLKLYKVYIYDDLGLTLIYFTARSNWIAYTFEWGKRLHRTNNPMIMKRGIEHYVLKRYKVYMNDDPELTLTYFTTMLNLTKLYFVPIVGPDIR